jgi:hypothetical protein
VFPSDGGCDDGMADMVEKIKRLEIELDCILKVVSSRMPHPRATTRVETTRSTPNLYHYCSSIPQRPTTFLKYK